MYDEFINYPKYNFITPDASSLPPFLLLGVSLRFLKNILYKVLQKVPFSRLFCPFVHFSYFENILSN